MRWAGGRAIFLAAAGLWCEIALAQPVPPVTSVPLPSREQIEQPAQPPRDQLPSTARLEAGGAMVAAPCALEDSPVRVSFTAVAFEAPDGGPLQPELQDLLRSAADVPRGEQPISVVCRVRDRANELLSQAGYVALAQIPPQEISAGTLRIQVITAKIKEIRVVGDYGPYLKLIQTRIETLRKLDPLNRHDAERILLLTGDIPGVDVSLTLSSANAAPGEVVGTLTVTTQRLQLLANIQNFGSSQIGPVIASVKAEVFGLAGLADHGYLAYSNSIDWKEARVGQGGYDVGLTQSGLRFSARGSLAFSRPDIALLDLRSRSIILGAELSHPLTRTVRRQLNVAVGFELLNQRVRIFQQDSSFAYVKDKLRILYGRLDGQLRLASDTSEFGVVDGYLELRKGIDIFGASQKGQPEGEYGLSRFDGDPEAFVVRGEVNATLQPSGPFSLGLSAFGQWSDEALLNLEEFSLGNFTYGRGYDPGSNGGDRIYAFRAEPRVRVPLPLPVSTEVSAFYDHVRVYNLDVGSEENGRTLRSVGATVRLALPPYFVVDLIYAKPLDRALFSDDRKAPDRFLISVTAQLYPFGSR